MKHDIVRVRHELRRRSLDVRAVERISPQMLRVTLTGDDLVDFTSLAPDDHIKLFVPDTDGATERRDYTPRRYDAAARQLILDFALHEAGPATDWAVRAKPGDRLDIAGPKGSVVVPADFDWWLLIGDETALPAIGRRIEELPAGTAVTSIVAVTAPEEAQTFDTAAAHHALWAYRPSARADDADALLALLQQFELPAGDGFVWIAAEAKVARAVRQHVLETLGHPAQWLKASGYWVKGRADAHEKMES